MPWLTLSLRLAFRAVFDPPLARDLLLVAWRFRRRDWYRHAPFLPVPAREYVAWRMYTAFGDSRAVPTLGEVVSYARWARRGR